VRGILLVRLIDVVLIILFGFIAISDIKVKRQINLPGSTDNEEQQTEEDQTILFWIDIDSSGFFQLEIEENVILKSDRLLEPSFS